MDMVGITMDILAVRPKQKLLPHFVEARTAILAIEQVEQSGHDRTSGSLSDRRFTRSITAHR
jgi:hypothetical protein